MPTDKTMSIFTSMTYTWQVRMVAPTKNHAGSARTQDSGSEWGIDVHAYADCLCSTTRASMRS